MVSVASGISTYGRGMEFAAVSKNAATAMYTYKLAVKSKYGEEVR